jgi:hypothetical protein
MPRLAVLIVLRLESAAAAGSPAQMLVPTGKTVTALLCVF